MPLTVASKRKKVETILAQYPNALILDVTSHGTLPWVKFSPFYPHGNIPVPYSPGYVSATVEGIWQGLKVFEHADVDLSKFSIVNMKGLKRSIRSYGKVRGHRAGVASERLLSYHDARYTIYLPAYKWVLDHSLQEEIAELRPLSQTQFIVLLDYETNMDIENVSKPLSHAALIVRYIAGNWPQSM
jgi:hypothetical protein